MEEEDEAGFEENLRETQIISPEVLPQCDEVGLDLPLSLWNMKKLLPKVWKWDGNREEP